MLRNTTIILVVANLLYSCGKRKDKREVVKAEVSGINKEKQQLQPIAPDTVFMNKWKEIIFNKTSIIERMAYADTSNFMHEKIYPCARCFLRPEAASALINANNLALAGSFRLVIFDCYRPKIYQQKTFDIVKNPDYVALSGKGSMHNRGLAIDIALADRNGRLLEFGCGFDDFSERAHYDFEGVSIEAKSNRKKLREIMLAAGFEPYKNEWWHFTFPKVQYPVDGFIWNCN